MIDSQLLNTIPFPSFVCNEERYIIAINDLMKENFSSFMNKNVKDVFDVWDENRFHSVAVAKLNGKFSLYLHHTWKNDCVLYIQIPDSLVTFIDALQESNRELTAIFENSYDGIYITDPKGKTLKTNSAIERITGIPKDYYINKSVDHLIKRGILKTSVTHEVLKKKKRVSIYQQNFAGKDLLLTGNPVFNEEGEIEKIVTNIRDLTELNELHRLNKKYKQELKKLQSLTSYYEDIVIKNEKMQEIFELVERVADVNATVLILGETGVGKDVIAGEIYNRSERAKTGKFIKVNCGAIPAQLLESELFGYESGAFTGASVQGKKGLFELADNGVIFLDEIGELPSDLQVKLLRVLQESEILRIGGTKPIAVNVRIVAATNRNLKNMVQEGRFREDLYYRLNVIPIHVPPLRERRDEILPLVQFFLDKMNEKYNYKKEFDHELKEFFYRYSWPGNIRELSNLVERLVLTTGNSLVTIHDLPTEYKKDEEHIQPFSETMSLKEAVESTEKQILQEACEKYRTTYEIAKALQTSQATIVRKLKKYQLTIS